MAAPSQDPKSTLAPHFEDPSFNLGSSPSIIADFGKVNQDLQSISQSEALSKMLADLTQALVKVDINYSGLDSHILRNHKHRPDLIESLIQKLLVDRFILDDHVHHNTEAFLVATFFILEVRRHHIQKIFSILGECTLPDKNLESKSFDQFFLKRTLKILKILYSNISNQQLYPNSYFTFGSKGSTAEIEFDKKQQKSDFFQSFAIYFWVYYDKNLHICSQPSTTHKKSSNIISLVTQSSCEGFSLKIDQEGQLIFVIEGHKNNFGNPFEFPLGKIKEDKWNFVAVSHEYSSWKRNALFNCKINSTKISIDNIPKLNFEGSKEKIQKLVLGGDLYRGKIGSLVYANKYDENICERLSKHVNFGVVSKSKFKNFEKIFSNEYLKTKSINLLLCPIFNSIDTRSLSLVDSNDKICLFQASDLKNQQKIIFKNGAGIFYKSTYDRPLHHLGSYKPLLELLNYCSTPENICLVLNMISKLLNNSPQNQILAIETGMVNALVGYLEPLAGILTDKEIRVIGEMIFETSETELLLRFIKYYLINFQFQEKLSSNVQSSLQEFCCQFFSESIVPSNLISPEEVITHMVMHESLLGGSYLNSGVDDPFTFQKDIIKGKTILGVSLVKAMLLKENPDSLKMQMSVNLILECIAMPHLPPTLQYQLLLLIKLIIQQNNEKRSIKFGFVDKLIPSVVLLIKHTMWAELKTLGIKIIHLVHRMKSIKVDISQICNLMTSILTNQELSVMTGPDKLREQSLFLEALYELCFDIEPTFGNEDPLFAMNDKNILRNPSVLNIILDIFDSFEYLIKQRILQDLLTIFSFSFTNTKTAMVSTKLLGWLTLSTFGMSLKEEDSLSEDERGIQDLLVKLMNKMLFDILSNYQDSEFQNTISMFLVETELFIQKNSQSKKFARIILRYKVDTIRSKVLCSVLKNVRSNLHIFQRNRCAMNTLVHEIIQYIFGNQISSSEKEFMKKAQKVKEIAPQSLTQLTEDEADQSPGVDSLPTEDKIDEILEKSENSGQGERDLKINKRGQLKEDQEEEEGSNNEQIEVSILQERLEEQEGEEDDGQSTINDESTHSKDLFPEDKKMKIQKQTSLQIDQSPIIQSLRLHKNKSTMENFKIEVGSPLKLRQRINSANVIQTKKKIKNSIFEKDNFYYLVKDSVRIQDCILIGSISNLSTPLQKVDSSINPQWIDESLADLLISCFQFYYVIDSLEHLSELIASQNAISFHEDLLQKNKRISLKPMVIKSMISIFCFCLDYNIENMNLEKVSTVFISIRKFIINVYVLYQLERQKKKLNKVKILESCLLFISIFISKLAVSYSEISSRKEDSKILGGKEKEMGSLLAYEAELCWRDIIACSRRSFYATLVERDGMLVQLSWTEEDPLNILKGTYQTLADILLTGKYRTLPKKFQTLEEVEELINDGSICSIIDDNWSNNFRVKDIIESEFGHEYIAMNKNLKTDLTSTLKKLLSTKKQQKDDFQRLRTHQINKLNKRLIEYRQDLQTTFEESLMNGESVIRECRQQAYSNSYSVRDRRGMWRDPTIDKSIQNDEVFRAKDFLFDNWKGNPFFVREVSQYTSQQMTRPFIFYKLQPYWSEGALKIDSYSIDDSKSVQTPQMSIFKRGDVKISKKVKKGVNNNIKSISKKIYKGIFKSSNFVKPQQNNSNFAKFLIENQNPRNEKFENNEVLFSRVCEWYKDFTILDGSLYITEKSLIFITDSHKSKNSHAMLLHSKKSYEPVKFSWSLKEVVLVLRRRVIQRQTGMEIFLREGVSLFFNFPSEKSIIDDLHIFLADILLQAGRKEAQVALTGVENYKSNRKLFEKLKIGEQWTNGKISNFEYLMLCNIYTGRSYNNLSQYHIFPWVLVQLKSQEQMKEEGLTDEDIEKMRKDMLQSSAEMMETDIETVDQEELKKHCKLDSLLQKQTLRDLSKPMGAMGSQKRVEHFRSRFKSQDMFQDGVEPYFYGSHYSSPAITTHFLLRLEPFCSAAKGIQNGTFDLPDRLFFSIPYSYRNAVEEISDVRELIPEFYSIPEFVINYNRLDLGHSQNGERIDQVFMPEWALNNPFLFIYLHRKVLESPQVSRSLQGWIDLVFGNKQFGKEGEAHLNLFYYLTYENQVEMESIDSIDRQAYEIQVVHFGQTPSQLFKKPHPSKNQEKVVYSSLMEGEISIKYQKRKNKILELQKLNPSNYKNFHEFHKKSVLSVSSVDQKNFIIVKRESVEYFKWELRNSKSNQFDKTYFNFPQIKTVKCTILEKYENSLNDSDHYLDNLNPIIAVIHRLGWVLVGGFQSGQIQIKTIGKFESSQCILGHDSTVTALKVTNCETILISGCKNGVIIFWSIESDSIQPRKRIFDFSSQITDLSLSYDSGIVAVGSMEGFIALYNVYSFQKMAEINHPQQLSISSVAISLYPFGVIIFISHEDNRLYVYSVNGQMIKQVQYATRVLKLQVSRQKNFLDILTIVFDTGKFYMLNLPFLESKKNFSLSKNTFVTTFMTIRNSEIIIAGDSRGIVLKMFVEDEEEYLTPLN